MSATEVRDERDVSLIRSQLQRERLLAKLEAEQSMRDFTPLREPRAS